MNSGKSWHAVAWLLQPSPVPWDTSLGPRERTLWPRSETAISINALAQSGPCLTVSTVWHKRKVSLLPHSTENHCPALHTKIALLCLPGGQHESLWGTGEQSGRAAALGVNFSWKEKREHYENAMRAVWEKRVFWVMIQIILYFQRLMISPHLQILLLCVSKPINDKGLAICLQRTRGTGKTKTDCKAEQKKGLEWNTGGREGSGIKIPSC